VTAYGVAISGKARAGKSELAASLAAQIAQRGIPAVTLGFRHLIEAETLKEYGVGKNDAGGRAMLVAHGDDRRKKDPAYWIVRMERVYARAVLNGVVPIIDDIRLPLELEWARSAQLFVVRLEVGEVLRRQRLEREGEDGRYAASPDLTETALDDADVSSYDLVFSFTTEMPSAHHVAHVVRREIDEAGGFAVESLRAAAA
jgi:hypothetical protein